MQVSHLLSGNWDLRLAQKWKKQIQWSLPSQNQLEPAEGPALTPPPARTAPGPPPVPPCAIWWQIRDRDLPLLGGRYCPSCTQFLFFPQPGELVLWNSVFTENHGPKSEQKKFWTVVDLLFPQKLKKKMNYSRHKEVAFRTTRLLSFILWLEQVEYYSFNLLCHLKLLIDFCSSWL